MTGTQKLLGELLLERGVITQPQLEQAMKFAKENNLRLASALFKLNMVSELDLAVCLSHQQGVPAVVLSRSRIKIANFKYVPFEILKKHLAIPLKIIDNSLLMGMVNPLIQTTVDEIAFVSGKQIMPFVVVQSSLVQALNEIPKISKTSRYYCGKDWNDDESSADPEGTLALVEIQHSILPDVDPFEANPETNNIGQEEKTSIRSHTALPETIQKDEPLKILLIDDEEDIRKIMTATLKKQGYQVIALEDGLKAIETIKKEKPNLVILDAMLPHIHGFELCKSIKSSELLQHIPVLMVSAIYRDEKIIKDVQEVYKADGFLEKPFRIQEFLNMVNRCIEKKESSNQVVIDQEFKKQALLLLKQGKSLLQQGKFDEAVATVRKCLDIDHTSDEGHFLLATCFYKQNHLYKAIEEYEKALTISPNFFPALKNLALLYQKKGFKTKAIELLVRAIGNSPDDVTKATMKTYLMDLL